MAFATKTNPPADSSPAEPDSATAWRRLAVALMLSTLGGIGLWSTVVVLPSIQAEFGVGRGGASLPYALTLVGFAVGGIFMGRISDRFGIVLPLIAGAIVLGGGFVLGAFALNYWHFLAIQCLLIGMLGSSVTFGPLVADITHWFVRRRGIAVAICASGNYLAGALWPPVLQYGIDTIGWRQTYMWIGIFVVVAMVPLALLMRRKAGHGAAAVRAPAVQDVRPSPIPLPMLQVVLIIAGLACCVAMSMPQVHMIAYCLDLGYGAARGAELLSIMLGLGVVSRLVSGVLADRIGGLGTLLIGSSLQCLALMFYMPFDGLASLYVVSALFGLAQGGIVPSYALIVRDYFPAGEAATRVTAVLMATVVGMGLGGWLSGVIFDFTGSYQSAFLNGIAWNLLNMSIAGWLLFTRLRPKLQFS